MKRLLSFVMVACVVLAPCAYADSILNINISYVTATLGPNGGVYFYSHRSGHKPHRRRRHQLRSLVLWSHPRLEFCGYFEF
jgi:hypothetical protein